MEVHSSLHLTFNANIYPIFFYCIHKRITSEIKNEINYTVTDSCSGNGLGKGVEV